MSVYEEAARESQFYDEDADGVFQIPIVPSFSTSVGSCYYIQFHRGLFFFFFRSLRTTRTTCRKRIRAKRFEEL
ncbi:hypothetical protein L1987_11374 [Smallanthus sonchifolius]|uniref:Uncharacterized protein n=1 Tax=Smallanthus sonchifolius TaxID=185202 RepID=A0ACB9JBL6_9ASTR|nr:hypothetical protein L1987_11374 [Smallanthus sonchifolius]